MLLLFMCCHPALTRPSAIALTLRAVGGLTTAEIARAFPMVTLNRAVAVAMVHGPKAGLALLEALDADPRIAGHHRLAAVRAHLHERAGDDWRALELYRRAAELTASTPERNYLRFKAARLAERATGNTN